MKLVVMRTPYLQSVRGWMQSIKGGGGRNKTKRQPWRHQASLRKYDEMMDQAPQPMEDQATFKVGETWISRPCSEINEYTKADDAQSGNLLFIRQGPRPATWMPQLDFAKNSTSRPPLTITIN